MSHDHEDPRQPDELRFFEVFETLREHVVDVVHYVGDRVSEQITKLAEHEQIESPSLADVCVRFLIENLNIFSHAVEQQAPALPEDDTPPQEEP